MPTPKFPFAFVLVSFTCLGLVAYGVLGRPTTPTTAPADSKTTAYRAQRQARWASLTKQYEALIKLSLKDFPAPPPLQALRVAVNQAVDELLTHLSPKDAAEFVASVQDAGWGKAPELLLYKATTGPALGGDSPWVYTRLVSSTPQWGGAVVPADVAADPAAWENWLRARLSALGVVGDAAERVFAVPMPFPEWRP